MSPVQRIKRQQEYLRETLELLGVKRINVVHIPSEYPLGTTDGQWYTVYPAPPDDDEEGQHGRD